MQIEPPYSFTKLRWYRLSVLLLNIRSSPTMSAHPVSVFQAIIKGVSTLIPPYSTITPSLQPNTSVSSLSETPIEPIDEAKQVGSESTGEISQGDYFREEQGIELHLTFHIKGRKHSLRMHEFESIPLEICFFKRGREYVNQWRDAFRAYLSDPVTGRNFEIAEMGEIEERCYEMVVSESGIGSVEGEICLEFLTPFPFKAEKGKARTYIAKDFFIRSFERRFSRLFGREIVYRSDDDQFSILPYYWRYTEIKHASMSQPGQTQYINGCAGKLYIKGQFKDFLPFLLLGSEIHTGTKISNAQGYYLLHKESPGFFKGYFPNKRAIVSVIRDVVSRYDNALLTLSETEKFPFNEEECAASIYQMIDCNTYSPSPNTAFAIRKKDGVDRVVEQLPFKDLIIQQYLLKTISPIFDRFFEEESIGFRKGVSRQKSIELIQAAIAEGYCYVIESDIEDFFPSVDLDILARLLDFYLPQDDACLKNILVKSIWNGFILHGVIHERKKGLAQGSPLSPILANLYLDSFDEQIKQWGTAKTIKITSNEIKGDMHALEQAQKEHFSEVAQCPVEDNKAFRDLKMVRYADDFIILTRTKEDAQNVLSDTESFLSTLGLKIKKEKTSIKPISEGFHFLGIRFERSAAIMDSQEDAKLLKKPLYIIEPYMFLSLNGDAIDICKDKKIIETIPLRRISEIMVMEKAVFSTSLLRKCTEGNIPLTIALNTGYYITTVKPDSKRYYDISYEHGKRYYSLSETELLCIAKEFAAGKINNYISLFKQKFVKEQYLFIDELEGVVQRIYQAGDIHQVRGFEGAAAKKIYQRLNIFIDDDTFCIRKRDRRNPDRINSMLNFGYYLLFSRINATVRAIGINPYLGFLHNPQDNYESLVCDIEELFRARIDRFIIRLINLKVVSRDDFDETERGLYLKRDAVRKFIDQFEAEMEKKNQKNSLSLKEDIYIQAIVIKKWALENGSLSFCHWEI